MDSPIAGLQLRIKLASAAGIGPGKIGLLAAVEECGSITAAAKALDMSYRRAWLLIDEMNRVFKEPVVESSFGGTKGGSTRLTGTGQAVVALYRDLERKAWDATAGELAALAGLLADEPRPPTDKNAKSFGKA